MKPTAVDKYKSFALTIRPKDGAGPVHDDLLCKFVQKYCEYYYVVSEKLGMDRHLHAGIFLKKPLSRGEVCTMLVRVYRELEDDEKRVLRQGVRIMYNFDFISSYLDKDDDTEVVLNCLPEEAHLESYWPPSKAQAKAKAAAAVDKYYANLERLWYEHVSPGVEVRRETVRNFLFDMMYSKRLIRVIRDDKSILQTAKHLERYISRTLVCDIVPPPWEE